MNESEVITTFMKELSTVTKRYERMSKDQLRFLRFQINADRMIVKNIEDMIIIGQALTVISRKLSAYMDGRKKE